MERDEHITSPLIPTKHISGSWGTHLINDVTRMTSGKSVKITSQSQTLPTWGRHNGESQGVAIKRMFVWLAVLVLTILLADNPPKHTQANPVNNSEAVTVQETEKTGEQEPVQPQPESWPKGCEHYVAEVSKYAWNVTVMVNVMKAESGCNPYAVGDNYPINGLHAPSCGLFQVRTLSSRPSCEALKDPATNIAWAYRIYQGQGYQAWSVCRTKVNCY